LILDAQGEPVWVDYSWGEVQDFKVQQFKGEDYLTFWAGVEVDIHGQGSWYMVSAGILRLHHIQANTILTPKLLLP
jgi:hypothetical protein